MRMVVYSLAALGALHCERQWIASIRSLRRYNRTIPVRLAVYGSIGRQTLAEASRHGVDVVLYGPYADCLATSGGARAERLAGNPTLHKIASMRDLPEELGQVLYLDCDTYCFGDIGRLFDDYAHAHFHAREEPGSRRSPNGYDPAYIDEGALEALAMGQGLAFIPPYNTGVMLLNGGLWTRLGEMFGEFLDYVWRFSAHAKDRASALRLPTSNAWIVEEVATWLILGRFPGLTHSPFSIGDVAQNGEALRFFADGTRPRLAHYFSAGEGDFFAAVNAVEDMVA